MADPKTERGGDITLSFPAREIPRGRRLLAAFKRSKGMGHVPKRQALLSGSCCYGARRAFLSSRAVNGDFKGAFCGDGNIRRGRHNALFNDLATGMA